MRNVYLFIYICNKTIVFGSGIGTVFESVGHQNGDSIRQQLEDIFHRDWYSNYSFSLNTSESSYPERSWGLSRNSYQHASYEPYVYV